MSGAHETGVAGVFFTLLQVFSPVAGIWVTVRGGSASGGDRPAAARGRGVGEEISKT